jgi:hypothetical protein
LNARDIPEQRAAVIRPADKGERMMQPAFRAMIFAVGVLGAPTAATILGSTVSSSSPTLKASQISLSVRDGRTLAATMGDHADTPIEFAEAAGWPWEPPVPRPDTRMPLPSGALPIPQPFGARFRGGFAAGSPLPPSTRSGCEEEIDRLTGLAGYLRSKMRLQGGQKDAWQKVELAAALPTEKLRELCSTLPSQPEPTNLVERIEFTEKQAAIRVDLFRAIHDPLHALYDSLSADQRALLAIPPRPFFTMLPPPHHGPAP